MHKERKNSLSLIICIHPSLQNYNDQSFITCLICRVLIYVPPSTHEQIKNTRPKSRRIVQTTCWRTARNIKSSFSFETILRIRGGGFGIGGIRGGGADLRRRPRRRPLHGGRGGALMRLRLRHTHTVAPRQRRRLSAHFFHFFFVNFSPIYNLSI